MDFSNISNIIVLIGSLVTAVCVIISTFKKLFTKAFQPVNDKIDELSNELNSKVNSLDERECRQYLISFMHDIELGQAKDEVQWKFVHEMYDHYINDLHGNSYVHDKWERVINHNNK